MTTRVTVYTDVVVSESRPSRYVEHKVVNDQPIRARDYIRSREWAKVMKLAGQCMAQGGSVRMEHWYAGNGEERANVRMEWGMNDAQAD